MSEVCARLVLGNSMHVATILHLFHCYTGRERQNCPRIIHKLVGPAGAGMPTHIPGSELLVTCARFLEGSVHAIHRKLLMNGTGNGMDAHVWLREQTRQGLQHTSSFPAASAVTVQPSLMCDFS